MGTVEERTTLHRKPILIPKQSIHEGHNMGRTLFLILTFNLALANHLKALKKTSDPTISITIQFYEVANNWQNSQRIFAIDDSEHDWQNSQSTSALDYSEHDWQNSQSTSALDYSEHDWQNSQSTSA